MTDYIQGAISAEQIAQSKGYLLLAFGTPWCGHCQAAESILVQALVAYPTLTVVKEEDGAGRRLGRLFKVKLWPSIILLKDGEEIARTVRPDTAQITALLAHIR